jgi:hypothetical protein
MGTAEDCFDNFILIPTVRFAVGNVASQFSALQMIVAFETFQSSKLGVSRKFGTGKTGQLVHEASPEPIWVDRYRTLTPGSRNGSRFW